MGAPADSGVLETSGLVLCMWSTAVALVVQVLRIDHTHGVGVACHRMRARESSDDMSDEG